MSSETYVDLSKQLKSKALSPVPYLFIFTVLFSPFQSSRPKKRHCGLMNATAIMVFSIQTSMTSSIRFYPESISVPHFISYLIIFSVTFMNLKFHH